MQPHTHTQTLTIWRSQIQPHTQTLTQNLTLTQNSTLTQNLTMTQNLTLTWNLTLTQIDFADKGFIIKTLYGLFWFQVITHLLQHCTSRHGTSSLSTSAVIINLIAKG